MQERVFELLLVPSVSTETHGGIDERAFKGLSSLNPIEVRGSGVCFDCGWSGPRGCNRGSSLVALFLWALSTLPLAAMFYGVRRANRWIYGVVEAIFGFLLCLALLLVTRYGAPAVELTLQSVGARILALMTGIFVLVRAYDNVGEGLRTGTEARKLWDRIFPKE